MQGVDVRRLRYFARIAQEGSLGKAAGILAIAQPALSRQMRLLEEEVGVPLFSRSVKGMVLTQEGEYLLASIAGPLRDLDLTFQNIRASSTKVAGDFAIGLPAGVNTAIGRALVLDTYRTYPDIRLKIVEGVTGTLLDWLARGFIDFAVLEVPSADERLEDMHLLRAPQMLIGAAANAEEEHDGAPMPLRAALQLPLILPACHLGARGRLNAAAAAARLPQIARFETDSPRLAIELVEAGMGYTILPEFLIPQGDCRARLSVRAIDGALAPFDLYLSMRRKNPTARSRAETRVIESIADLVGRCSKSSASDASAGAGLDIAVTACA